MTFEISKVNMFNAYKAPVQQIGAVGARGAEETKGPGLFGTQKTGVIGGYEPNYAQYDLASPKYENGMNVPGGKAGLALDFMC